MWGQGIRRAFSRSPEKYLRLSQYSGSDLPFVPVPASPILRFRPPLCAGSDLPFVPVSTSPMLRFLLPIHVRCFR
ncbi:MAG: hypothetical protein BWX87_01470 [Bacteroidetes bacterium ADurb.Bin123]|nr:MAG: hypothetical protein BWX87_01470 [Bacteroidetes bacterium ADurb.Bin123]